MRIKLEQCFNGCKAQKSLANIGIDILIDDGENTSLCAKTMKNMKNMIFNQR